MRLLTAALLLPLAFASSSPALLVRIPTPLAPCGVGSGYGAVWVGSGKDSTEVFRVDPTTLAVVRVPVSAAAPGWFVAGASDVWVVTSQDSVVRIDPTTNRVVATLPVQGVPVEGATAPDGLLWIPSKQSNTVTRIDPVDNRIVDVLPAGPGAYVAHRAFGSMWVTSYAGADVRRYRP